MHEALRAQCLCEGHDHIFIKWLYRTEPVLDFRKYAEEIYKRIYKEDVDANRTIDGFLLLHNDEINSYIKEAIELIKKSPAFGEFLKDCEAYKAAQFKKRLLIGGAVTSCAGLAIYFILKSVK